MFKPRAVIVVFAVLLILLFAGCDPLKIANMPANEGKVVIDKNIAVPMDDGVKLIADLYHPPGDGPWPVIVNRLPYGVMTIDRFAKYYASTGYAFLAQDTRGRYRSEGGGEKFMPFLTEEADGRATLAWIKKQPWCNGRIGAWGGSYHGFTQWALAPDNPDLNAMVPMITGSDIYRLYYNIGGPLRLRMMLGWGMKNLERKTKQFAGNPKKGFWKLPLIEADDVALDQSPWWDMVVAHPRSDEFWAPVNFSGRIKDVRAPALMISGWYDILNTGLIEDFEKWQARGADAPKARLIVGPWNHAFVNTNLKNVEWGYKDIAPLIFGQTKMWFDRWLKDKRNGADEIKPVHIFVMGVNEWRDYDQWPPETASPSSMYLQSEGNANTTDGDGVLATEIPSGDKSPDEFDYDPRNPVPTEGGQGLLPWDAGPADQRKIEQRNDVLVYTSAALENPITAIGPVKVKLFASTSAVDTDFTAKLVDVYPDGKAIIVCEGILRGRYLEGDETKFLDPGKIYEWNINLGYTAITFKPGHRIRLEISSSNFPRFNRNLNTAEDLATGTKIITAHQKVYHNAQYPSQLILSILTE